MDTQHQESTFLQIAIKYGLILAMAGIMINLMGFITNSQISSSLFWGSLNYVAIAGTVVLAMIARKNDLHNGFLSYAQGLGIGTLVGLFAGVLVALYQMVYQKYIDPEFFDRLIIEAKKGFIEKKMPEEQIESAMLMMEKMKNPIYIFFTTVLGQTFMAFLFSLVIAIFVRKQDPSTQYTD